MTAKNKVKFKAWQVISTAVEEGAAHGVHRAYKYTDHPSENTIAESVESEVMNSLAEVIDFDDD